MGEKRDGSGQGYVPRENGPEPENGTAYRQPLSQTEE